MKRILPIVAFLSLFLALALPAKAQRAMEKTADRSLMASGHWVKIRVDASGVYRLTDEQLRANGFSDPSKVGVFGYGGGVLPEDLSRITTDDLPPVPVLRQGNALYFYAVGPVTWFYNPAKTTMEHTVNTYSTHGYYFLSDAAGAPLQMSQYTGGGASAEALIDYYDELMLHEQELYSPKESGRDLYGESFSAVNTRTVKFPLRGNTRSSGELGTVFSYIAKARSAGGGREMSLSANGLLIFSDPFSMTSNEVSNSYLAGKKRRLYHSTPMNSLVNELRLDANYSMTGDAVNLDFIEVATQNDLRYDGAPMHIRRFSNLPVWGGESCRFVISEVPESLVVLQANSSLTASLVPVKTVGDKTIEFVAPPKGQDRRTINTFYAVDLSQASAPEILGAVPNQNLHGEEIPDLIIVSTQALLPEADRLATYRREKNGLKVLVVLQEQVFNEFSGGTPDATAYRLFAKMFYDRWKANAPVGETFPMQMLLFGDGAHDNRKVSVAWQKPYLQQTEFLLTFQAVNSTNVNSYVTDDYFGLLDDQPASVNIGWRNYNMAVGRFPVRTPAEARIAVDKTIRYEEDRESGAWRIRACFAADNGDKHATETSRLIDTVKRYAPAIMPVRAFQDVYPHVIENGLHSIPGAKKKMLETLQSGIILLNYAGHGGPAGWSDEHLLTLNDIHNFNYKHMPIWITATCDFANYDSQTTSAGEEVFLHEKSGTPIMFSTTRVVYNTQNEKINGFMLRRMFEKAKDGRYRTMGEIIRSAKQGMLSTVFPDSINQLSFFLMGDPSVRMNLPTHKVQLTAINGQDPEGQYGTIMLKSLERVALKGKVTDEMGTFDETFSGKVFLTVFDGRKKMTALEEEGNDLSLVYYDYPNVMYAGIAEVKDGLFETSFIVPKDVNYSEHEGRINLYAYNESTKAEAMGVDFSIRVQPGIPDEVTEDNTPPEIISCFLNDSTFRSGDEVNPTPLFMAEVFDLNGINITGSGVGHDITLCIDGRADLTYNLNAYFTSSATDAGVGTILFMIPALAEGDHTARLTVWDIFNNAVHHDFSFRVVDGIAPDVADVILFPNPVRESATFRIFHNRPRSDLNVAVEIYDFTGRLVNSLPVKTYSSSYGEPIEIKWDLTSKYGVKIGNGFYLYRCVVNSPGGQTASMAKKMIVVGQ